MKVILLGGIPQYVEQVSKIFKENSRKILDIILEVTFSDIVEEEPIPGGIRWTLCSHINPSRDRRVMISFFYTGEISMVPTSSLETTDESSETTLRYKTSFVREMVKFMADVMSILYPSG
ncbi:MAG TPA: hypothetical protein VGE63_01670 [Candidatus Paceibacterota bacterium]